MSTNLKPIEAGPRTIKSVAAAGKGKKVTFEDGIAAFVNPSYVSAPVEPGQTANAVIEIKTWDDGNQSYAIKEWGAPKPARGGGGGGAPAAWRNTKEGFEAEQGMWAQKHEVEQAGLNRRTALMQAVELLKVSATAQPALVIETAQAFFGWLSDVPRGTVAAPLAPACAPASRPADTQGDSSGNNAGPSAGGALGTSSKAPAQSTAFLKPTPADVRKAAGLIGVSDQQYAGFKTLCKARSYPAGHVLLMAVRDGVKDFDGLTQFLTGLPNAAPGAS